VSRFEIRHGRNLAARSRFFQSIDRIVIIRRMNLAGVDLNLLVALDALLVERHVGRAARRIGLSQPAASHALRRLRTLLGDPLLVRVGARMELTPRAAALSAPLADALRQVWSTRPGKVMASPPLSVSVSVSRTSSRLPSTT